MTIAESNNVSEQVQAVLGGSEPISEESPSAEQLATLGESTDVVEKPVEEIVVAEAIVEPAPVQTPTPKAEAEVVPQPTPSPAPVSAPEITPVVVAEAPTGEVTLSREQHEQLLTRIEELAQQAVSGYKQPEPTPTMAPEVAPAPPVSATVVPLAAPVDYVEYVTEAEFADIFQSASAFNHALNKVRNAVREEAMRSVLPVVERSAALEARRQALAIDFFRANPELGKFRSLVIHTAQQVSAQNPTMLLEDVMTETAKSVKTLIQRAREPEAVAPTVAPVVPITTQPGFAPAPGARLPRRGSPSGVEEEQRALIAQVLASEFS